MRDPLTLAVAQPPCVGHDLAANAVAHAATVRASGARVVVFPELSLTGYELDAVPVAPDDPRLAPLVAACTAQEATALVGAPVPGSCGRPHLAMLAADRTGVSVVYHKMWLGGAEPERFAPGEKPAVHEVDGRRLGLALCKDTGVAQHAAATAALGIDVYVAGTAEVPEAAAEQSARARRIATDHGVHVAVASFAGPTGGGFDRTAGRSGIWAPGGSVLEQAGTETGAIVRAAIA